MAQQKYTFGDSDLAGVRLRALAQLFEPSLRAFLARAAPKDVSLAVDLGCGPGHSTLALAESLGARRVIGIERSPAHLERALALGPSKEHVEYVQHDVTKFPLPVAPADLVYSRFLLTHLSDPACAVHGWARALRRGGTLLLQETAVLESEHPALRHYYTLVARLQEHYGQVLHIGKDLAALVATSSLRIVDFRVTEIDLSAARMAELHSMNLRTWRQDAFASRAFDAEDLDRLQRALDVVAGGRESAAVRIALGELVAERP